MEMALHEEGTHVLQKLIQVFLEKERQDLTDVLCTQKNVEKLCQDLKGISVIKRLISFNKEIANRIKLVESFYPNMPIISKSSSGAYIVNYLLEQWGIDIGLKLVNCCIIIQLMRFRSVNYSVIIYFLAFPTLRATTNSPTEIKPAKNFSKPPVAQIASPNVELTMLASYSSAVIF